MISLYDIVMDIVMIYAQSARVTSGGSERNEPRGLRI